jgi:hypothetical protein
VNVQAEVLALFSAVNRRGPPEPGELPLPVLYGVEELVAVCHLVELLRRGADACAADARLAVECAVADWLAVHQLPSDVFGEPELPDVEPCPVAFDFARAELAAFAFPRGTLH